MWFLKNVHDQPFQKRLELRQLLFWQKVEAIKADIAAVHYWQLTFLIA